MPSQEEIHQQLSRLALHRETLALYLSQEAQFGPAYVSPLILHGKNDARKSIKIIKATLQKWNIPFEDHPDDEDAEVSPPIGSRRDARTPLLSVRFPKEDEPFIAQSVNAGYRVTVFYRLAIENSGSVAATNVEGWLLSVRPDADPRNLFGKPMRLKWAHEEAVFPITVEPREERKLDLFYFFPSEPTWFEFFIEPTMAQGIPRRFPRGSYTIAVRITSANAQTVEATFRIQTETHVNVAHIDRVLEP